MRLALHVAAKDLRAHRVLVAAWGVALLTDLLLSTGWAHGFVVSWPMAYDLKRLAASLLSALLGALVVVAAIQGDPHVGTTAFWLTRPIGRGTLVLAKLLIVAVAVTVPALEQVTAAVIAQASATDAWRILVEALFIQALIVLPLAAVATMTADAGRYALTLVAALAALPVVGTAVSYVVAGRILSGRPVAKMFAAAALVAAGSLLVIGHQALTRKTRRSAAIAVLSAVMVVAVLGSFTSAARPRSREDHGSRLPTNTRPEIQARVGTAGVGRQAVGRDRLRLLVDLEVTGLGRDLLAVPMAVRSSWSFAGGPTLEGKEIGFPSGWWHDTVPRQPLFREALGRLLRAEVAGSSGFRERALGAGPGFDLATLEANYDRPGSLTLDVEWLLVRMRVAGRLPLQAGERVWAGQHHLVVLPDRGDRLVDVRVSHLRPSLLLRGGMWQDAASGLALVATNRSHGEVAVVVSGIGGGYFGGGLSHVRNRILSLGYTDAVDRQWLSGAEIAAVTLEPDGMVRRIVRVDGVRLADLPSVGGRGL